MGMAQNVALGLNLGRVLIFVARSQVHLAAAIGADCGLDEWMYSSLNEWSLQYTHRDRSIERKGWISSAFRLQEELTSAQWCYKSHKPGYPCSEGEVFYLLKGITTCLRAAREGGGGIHDHVSTNTPFPHTHLKVFLRATLRTAHLSHSYYCIFAHCALCIYCTFDMDVFLNMCVLLCTCFPPK
jgi:hypothetical protein